MKNKEYDILWPVTQRTIEDINANFDALWEEIQANEKAIAGKLGIHDILSYAHGDAASEIVQQGDVIYGKGTSPVWSRLAAGTAGQVLTMGATEPAWSTHSLLSATHDDTTAAAVVRGDVVIGSGATPKWTRLAKGTQYHVLMMGANEPAWAAENDPEFALTLRHGFVDLTETSIAFDGTNTVTLTSVGATWRYFRSSVLCTITGSKTVVIPGTPIADGVWFIYIDSEAGTLIASQTTWTLLDGKVTVAILFFTSGATPEYFLADERHTCLIDQKVHYHDHFTEGSKLVSGAALTGYSVAPVGPIDTNNTFAISETVLLDEDLRHVLGALADGGGLADTYWILYRTALTTWVWEGSEVPFRYTAAGYIQYDNAGTMTEGQNNKFYNTYLLFTNYAGTGRFLLMHGRAEFGTLVAAQAEAPSSFDLTTLGIAEFVIGYQLTWDTSAAYGTLGKARLAATPKRLNLSVITSNVSAGTVDHNSLAGLQGGTTAQYYHWTSAQYNPTRGDILYGNVTPEWAKLAAGALGDVLTMGAAEPGWAAPASGTHDILSATHTDSTAAAVVRGDIIIGSGASPLWTRLAAGAPGEVLTMGANEPAWAASGAGAHDLLSATHGDTTAHAVVRGDLITGQGAVPTWDGLAAGSEHDTLQMGANEPAWVTNPEFPTVGIGVAPEANIVLKVTGHQYQTLYDAGNTGAALTIDWNNGNRQKCTLTADCTFTFSNPKTGGHYFLELIQDGTGGWEATWPVTVSWAGAVAPVLATAAGTKEIFGFQYDGATYNAVGGARALSSTELTDTANIAYLDAANVFTAQNTFRADITLYAAGRNQSIFLQCADGYSPRIQIYQLNHAAWYLYNPANSGDLRLYDDIGAADVFTFTQAGTLSGPTNIIMGAGVALPAWSGNVEFNNESGVGFHLRSYTMQIDVGAGVGAPAAPTYVAAFALSASGNASFTGNVDIVGTARVRTLGAFAASDKYVIADANGNLHVSATGPAS